MKQDLNCYATGQLEWTVVALEVIRAYSEFENSGFNLDIFNDDPFVDTYGLQAWRFVIVQCSDTLRVEIAKRTRYVLLSEYGVDGPARLVWVLKQMLLYSENPNYGDECLWKEEAKKLVDFINLFMRDEAQSE